MVNKSKQQAERLIYREGLHRSNDTHGVHRSSSSTPYSSNDLDKEGYSAPFIPRSTSYVEYSKQYPSKSNAINVSSIKSNSLSVSKRSVASAFPIIATYDYSPFGQLIATSGTPELSPIQFSSEVFDPETALTYYNHRYYNPTDGRWLSRDPAEESVSLNLYAFVKNAPVYLIDYIGLSTNRWIAKDTIANDPNPDIPQRQGIENAISRLLNSSNSSLLLASLGNLLYKLNSASLSGDTFAKYALHYFNGYGGQLDFDVKSFMEKDKIFMGMVKSNLRLAGDFAFSNNLINKNITFNEWRNTSASRAEYTYTLGGFNYTILAKFKNCGYFEYEVHISDLFDFHWDNPATPVHIPQSIATSLDVSPFKIKGVYKGEGFYTFNKINEKKGIKDIILFDLKENNTNIMLDGLEYWFNLITD